jgi:CSLREA domain-containing protein
MLLAPKSLSEEAMRKTVHVLLGLTAILLATTNTSANDFVVNTTQDADLANPSNTLCVSTLGNCTLRAAIHAAENVGSGPHRIALTTSGTYVLTLGGLTIDGITVLIENTSVLPGPPPTPGHVAIDGGGLFTVLTVGVVSAATVFLYGRPSGGFTIQNGNGGGGAIFNSGTTTLTNLALSGNSDNGGHNGGAISSSGTMTLTNVTLSGNSASVSGGAIDNGGTMTLTNVTISGNSANGGVNGAGGGIFALAG